MEIKSVTKCRWYYYIHREDDVIHLQRRAVHNATDSPLTPDEITIVALCNKVCSGEVEK